MAELTEEYVLEADYDPKAYMEFFNLNENSLEYEFIKFVLRHHYKTFTPGKFPGGCPGYPSTELKGRDRLF